MSIILYFFLKVLNFLDIFLKKEGTLRIALLDNNQIQINQLTCWFNKEGHYWKLFRTGKSLIKGLSRDSFDSLVVSWGTPLVDNKGVLSTIREHINWPIPILFIIEPGKEASLIQIINVGVEDFITRPVQRLEILTRINMLNKRSQGYEGNNETLNIGDFRIDTVERRISKNKQVIDLTGKEFVLAAFLLKHQGRILSRDHILEAVWGYASEMTSRTVDTHISRIRKKLDLHPEKGWRLSAIYQQGYQLIHLAHELEHSQSVLG